VVLSQEPYSFNTRAAGIVTEYALIPVDDVLVAWADEIVVMEAAHKKMLVDRFHPSCPVVCLNISDNFSYRDERLMALVRENYDKEAK